MRKYFSMSVYTATLRRYWSGSALLALLGTLMAFAYSQDIADRGWNEGEIIRARVGGMLLEQGMIFACAAVVSAAAVVCAILVFSYMHDRRAVVMMFSLPIRREAHFISAFLGGLTLLWAPVLLCTLEFMLAQVMAGHPAFEYAAILMLITFLCSLTAYTITVFAAFLTGSSVGQFCVTGLIMILPVALEAFFIQMCRRYLFGFGYDGGGGMSANMLLHPVFIFGKLSGRVKGWMPNWYAYPGNTYDSRTPFGAGDFGLILFLLGYCAAFAVLALLLARGRRLETAGDFVAVRGMRPVLRYGAAFLSAYVFGMFADTIYYGSFVSGTVIRVIFAVVGGAVGFFVAEMFIRKTAKVFRRWKGAALFGGCYAAVVLSLIFDIYGYGSYALPGDKVESLWLSRGSMPYEGSAEWMIEPMPDLFTGGDGLDEALDLQDYIAKNGRQHAENYSPYTSFASGVRNYEDVSGYHQYIYMDAKLTDGRTVRRRYSMVLPAGGGEWRDKFLALSEAVKPKHVEQLRDISRKAVRMDMWADYYDDTENHSMNAVWRGGEIAEFIDMLVLDNAVDPHWNQYYNYNDYFGRWYIPDAAKWQDNINIVVVFLETSNGYNEKSINIRVSLRDENAIGWLIERGYLTREFLTGYQRYVHRQNELRAKQPDTGYPSGMSQPYPSPVAATFN